MWIFLLLIVGVLLGLSSGKLANWERQVVFVAVVIAVGYEAVTKHLL
jgi:hypothetical protein